MPSGVPRRLLQDQVRVPKVSPLLQDLQRCRSVGLHIVPLPLYAGRGPLHGVSGVAVLRPAHADLQDVPRELPVMQRPRPVLVRDLCVPAAPGPAEQPVCALLRQRRLARGPELLPLRQGNRRLHQLVPGRQAPRRRRTAAAPVRGRSGSGRRSIRHQRRRSRFRPAGLAPAGSARCFADRHHRDGHLGLSARGDRVRRDLQRAAETHPDRVHRRQVQQAGHRWHLPDHPDIDGQR
uniref:(northern house mosquito) hypothetical protein n=1 Tax=Culex pipiens TaxID=7175 RepID=A0A8D7ZYR7_CULPI